MHKMLETIVANVKVNLLSQGLTLLLVPILSQVYDLESYGLFATFLSINAFVSLFAGYRLDIAALSVETEQEAHKLLSISVFLSMLLAPCLLLLNLLSILNGLAIALFMATPLIVLIQAASTWLIRAQRIGPIAIGRLLNVTVMGGTQWALGYLRVEHGLVLGFLAGTVANALYLLTVWRPSVQRFHLWSVLINYRAFGITSGLAATLNTLTLQAPQLLLAGLFGPASAGAFAVAQRLTIFPVTLLAQPLSQAYVGLVSSALRDGKPIQSLFGQFAGMALILGVPLAFGLAGLVPWFLSNVLSLEWRAAQTFVPASTAMLVPTLLMSVVGLSFNLLRRTRVQFCWDAARLLTVCIAFALAFVLKMTASEAAWAFVGVLIVFACIYAALIVGQTVSIVRKNV